MTVLLRQFRTDEKGATSIEYALIASIMMIAVIGGAKVFSEEVRVMYQYVTNSLTESVPSSS